MRQDTFFYEITKEYTKDSAGQRDFSVLAVGTQSEWRRAGCRLPDDGGVALVSFHTLNKVMLERLEAKVVLSPMVAIGFDCVELAEKLQKAGFSGQFRAVTKPLPKPELVLREMRQHFPKLDFDLLFLE